MLSVVLLLLFSDAVAHTCFSLGSLTVSARLLSALRICDAATDVEVFSNACSFTPSVSILDNCQSMIMLLI